MKRIKKHKSSNKVVYELKNSLLKIERLCDIVDLFNLDNLYVDILLNKIKVYNLVAKLQSENFEFAIINQDGIYQDISIKIDSIKMKQLIEILKKCKYDELDISDSNLNFDEYISKKKLYEDIKGNNFQLISNNYESTVTKIICPLNYDNENIVNSLESLIN